jgi:signal transduction histidine kinase
MDSLLGIAIFFLLFLILSGTIYLLIKKNIFSSSSNLLSNKKINSSQDKFSKLQSIKRENEELNREIAFLEEKNRRLKLKIKDLRAAIAELEEQKYQLEHSEKTLKELRIKKDEALAIVAHDIKNPASTIKNFVELLETYDLSMQEQKDVFASLIETSSRLVKLTNEFTQVVSEEYTTLKLNISKHNILDIVNSIVKTNTISAKNKNIDLKLYQPEREVVVDVDEDKMKEVVDNFVANAIKFCPENSKVEITTKIDKSNVLVEVSDNGYGLTENEIALAFEKGSKFKRSNTSDESSSGLGLWIAKKIVEEHNGRVWVKSKKGLGATFSFTLPIK